MKQLGFFIVPSLHGLHGRLVLEGKLWQLVVVQRIELMPLARGTIAGQQAAAEFLAVIGHYPADPNTAGLGAGGAGSGPDLSARPCHG